MEEIVGKLLFVVLIFVVGFGIEGDYLFYWCCYEYYIVVDDWGCFVFFDDVGGEGLDWCEVFYV